MIYCTSRSVCAPPPTLSPLVFSPASFLLPCSLVNLGPAMESNYTVSKVYSDLLKALNAICFHPSLFPPPREAGSDTQMRWSERSLLAAPSSVI